MDIASQFYSLIEARTAIEDGRYEIASERLLSLLSKIDDRTLYRDAFALLGVCRGYMDDDDEALEAFKASIEIGGSNRHFEFLPYRFFCDMEDLILEACYSVPMRYGYGYPYDTDTGSRSLASLTEKSTRRGEKRTPTWEEEARIARSAIRSVTLEPDLRMALEAISDGFYDEGIEIFRGLAADQNAEAAYQLACLFDSESDNHSKEEETITLLNQAAEAGLIEAQMKLGMLLGDDSRQCYDPRSSALWINKVANAGDSNGQLQLAIKLITGIGLEADHSKAAMWLERSAASGNYRAKFLLACLYFEGNGVERSIEEAGKLWLACAREGMPQAAFELGRLCMHGHRFLDDFQPNVMFESEIDYWLQKAAMNGYPEAQYLLGVERMSGEHLRQDLRVAYRWLSNAVSNGVSKADQAIESLRADIGEEEFKELKQNPSPFILWSGWPRGTEHSSF